MVTTVASPRKSINTVFQRFAGGSSQKKRKYDVQDDYEGEGTVEMVQIGADKTKNVLILMSDTGGGHRASAEAIRDAFRLEFGDEYQVVDPFLYLVLIVFLCLDHFLPVFYRRRGIFIRKEQKGLDFFC